MPAQPRKLSEIMKEMSETLLSNPGGVPSSEAAHVALFFANVAWNESVGLDPGVVRLRRRGYGHIEIGDQELFGFVARALDYGGLAFEDDRPDTLAEALASLEKGLRKWFKEQGAEVEGRE